MIRQRSDEQVRASAAQMDTALDGGLTGEMLAALTAARTVWRDTGRLPAEMFTADVTAALGHPAADGWDSVFAAAARRRARELSVPLPNVRP